MPSLNGRGWKRRPHWPLKLSSWYGCTPLHRPSSYAPRVCPCWGENLSISSSQARGPASLPYSGPRGATAGQGHRQPHPPLNSVDRTSLASGAYKIFVAPSPGTPRMRCRSLRYRSVTFGKFALTSLINCR